MNLVEDKIVHLLTGKHNLFEVSVDELQAISDEQPFFSVAQLLLTQKMKQVNHPGFVQQLQKTALFFPNIFWLDKHLQEASPQAATPAVTKTPAPTTPSYETATGTSGSGLDATTTYNNTTVAASIPEVATPPSNTSGAGYHGKEDDSDLNPITAQYSQQEEESMPEAITVEDSTIATESVDDYTAPVIEEVTGNSPESVEVIAHPVTTPYVAPEPESAATPPVTDASVEAEAPSAALAQDTQASSSDYEHSIKESFAFNTTAPTGDEEDDLPVDALGETGDHEMPSLRLAEIMQQQANTFNKPVAENEVLPIESEPYHTIDYFASQGIKAENNTEDGLAKKVRKFTDWLKQMKKVAPLPSDLGTDAELEQVVHGIAATSIESKEIVTEAMAEVLVKQGRIDKAVLLYSKLSFLNPDKTAYFAAKILELKGN